MITPARAALGLTATLLATGLTACSTTPEDPKQAIEEALSKMVERDEMSVILDLDASAEDWTEALGGGADTLVPANILSETTLDLRVETTGDKSLTEEDDPDKTDLTFVADIGGKAPIIVTLVEGDLAVRVDMKDMVEVTGTSTRDEVRRLGRESPQEWQQAFFKGRWLAVDHNSPADLAGQMAQSGGMAGAGAGILMGPQEVLDTREALVTALDQHSTASYAEDKDVRELGKAIEVSIETQPFLAEVAQARGGDAPDTSMLADDATLEGTFWIRRGLITRAEFPLSQMTGIFDPATFGANGVNPPENGMPGNLVITYDRRAMIEKPYNPTPVTGQDLMLLLGG